MSSSLERTHQDIIDRFTAGESVISLSRDYNLSRNAIEHLIRVVLKAALRKSKLLPDTKPGLFDAEDSQ